MSQTNIKDGDLVIIAGEDLTGKEDYLCMLTHDTGVPEVKLPTANDTQPLYLLLEVGEDTDNCDVRPLDPGKSVRIKFKSTGNPGDIVVLADVSVSADKGKVRALPSAAGTYRGLGWLEEAAVDGQLALVRICPQGNITVS